MEPIESDVLLQEPVPYRVVWKDGTKETFLLPRLGVDGLIPWLDEMTEERRAVSRAIVSKMKLNAMDAQRAEKSIQLNDVAVIGDLTGPVQRPAGMRRVIALSLAHPSAKLYSRSFPAVREVITVKAIRPKAGDIYQITSPQFDQPIASVVVGAVEAAAVSSLLITAWNSSPVAREIATATVWGDSLALAAVNAGAPMNLSGAVSGIGSIKVVCNVTSNPVTTTVVNEPITLERQAQLLQSIMADANMATYISQVVSTLFYRPGEAEAARAAQQAETPKMGGLNGPLAEAVPGATGTASESPTTG
jgi:hypothetical protein